MKYLGFSMLIFAVVLDVYSRWLIETIHTIETDGVECARVGIGDWSCWPTVTNNVGVRDAIKVLVLR
jgi:hypothetical protein